MATLPKIHRSHRGSRVNSISLLPPFSKSAPGAQTTMPPPSGARFENAHVRVWKSIILPNQPLNVHRHEFGRTIVALRGGTLDVVDSSGKTLKQMTWETGKAYWLDADPPGQQHGDINHGTTPIEVIVVEMRR